jgi:hypothetical protein
MNKRFLAFSIAILASHSAFSQKTELTIAKNSCGTIRRNNGYPNTTITDSGDGWAVSMDRGDFAPSKVSPITCLARTGGSFQIKYVKVHSLPYEINSWKFFSFNDYKSDKACMYDDWDNGHDDDSDPDGYKIRTACTSAYKTIDTIDNVLSSSGALGTEVLISGQYNADFSIFNFTFGTINMVAAPYKVEFTIAKSSCQRGVFVKDGYPGTTVTDAGDGWAVSIDRTSDDFFPYGYNDHSNRPVVCVAVTGNGTSGPIPDLRIKDVKVHIDSNYDAGYKYFVFIPGTDNTPAYGLAKACSYESSIFDPTDGSQAIKSGCVSGYVTIDTVDNIVNNDDGILYFGQADGSFLSFTQRGRLSGIEFIELWAK